MQDNNSSNKKTAQTQQLQKILSIQQQTPNQNQKKSSTEKVIKSTTGSKFIKLESSSNFYTGKQNEELDQIVEAG